jgi:hypothetical protein
MNILKIIILLIFIVFTITYIVLISKLDVNPSKINIDLINKRDKDINNLNIIGIIFGIIISVTDIYIINKLNIKSETLLIIMHMIKIIIYIVLISISGTTYSDYYTLIKTMSVEDTNAPTPTNTIVDNNAKWSIAIKPLVPFLCALSIQSMIIILTNFDNLFSGSYNKIPISSISSENQNSSSLEEEKEDL